MYVPLYLCTCMYLCTSAHVCTSVPLHMYVLLYLCTCMSFCTSAHVCPSVPLHMYVPLFFCTSHMCTYHLHVTQYLYSQSCDISCPAQSGIVTTNDASFTISYTIFVTACMEAICLGFSQGRLSNKCIFFV